MNAPNQQNQLYVATCTQPAVKRFESNFQGSDWYVGAKFELQNGTTVSVYYNDNKPQAYRALGNLSEGEQLQLKAKPKQNSDGWSWKLTDQDIARLAQQGTPRYMQNGQPQGGQGAPPNAGGAPQNAPPQASSPPGSSPQPGGSAPQAPPQGGQTPQQRSGSSSRSVVITQERADTLMEASGSHAGLLAYLRGEIRDALVEQDQIEQTNEEQITEMAIALYDQLIDRL